MKSIDGQVNSLQRDRLDNAPSDAAKKAAIADDTAWLAKRKSSCAKANQTGGTIDEINTAGCLLKASKARVTALQAG